MGKTLTNTDDPKWNAASYSINDAKAAINQNPFNVQTWNGDLSTFKARGGKVCKLNLLHLGLKTH